jgi:hypothetical protein
VTPRRWFPTHARRPAPMPLPEYVVPVISIAGPVALVFVILRCFPHVARAVVVLLAGIAAIVTTSKERREASIKVLDALGHPSRSEPIVSLRSPEHSQFARFRWYRVRAYSAFSGGTTAPQKKAPDTLGRVPY